MNPTTIIFSDGTAVALEHDHPWGWHAKAGDLLVHVTAVCTSVTSATPAKARMAPPSAAEYVGRE